MFCFLQSIAVARSLKCEKQAGLPARFHRFRAPSRFPSGLCAALHPYGSGTAQVLHLFPFYGHQSVHLPF